MYENEIVQIARALIRGQSLKARRNLLNAIPNLQDVLEQSITELDKTERAIIGELRRTYTEYSFKGEVDYDKLYNDLQSEYVNNGNTIDTRRQKGFGTITSLDSAKMISSAKKFGPTKQLITPNPKNPTENYSISIAFGEGKIDDEKYLFTKQVIDKPIYDASGTLIRRNPSEFALYASPGGDINKETLALRMDCSGQEHRNSFDFGRDWSAVSPNPVKDYHIHHLNFFGTNFSHNQSYGNGVPTECIAISTKRLALYLKALDGKNVPELSGVDLTKTFGLPYTYMKEHNLYPQADITAFVSDFKKGAINDQVKSICDKYINANKGKQSGFGKFSSMLDFLNELDDYRDANMNTLTQAELLTITNAISKTALQTFESLTKVEGLVLSEVKTADNKKQKSVTKEQEQNTGGAPSPANNTANNPTSNNKDDNTKEDAANKTAEQKINAAANDLVSNVEKELEKDKENDNTLQNEEIKENNNKEDAAKPALEQEDD